jgi:hypothetical protein
MNFNRVAANVRPTMNTSNPIASLNSTLSRLTQNTNVSRATSSVFLNVWVVVGIIAVVALVCYVYHRKIGYYISLGWSNLQQLVGDGDSVDIQFNGGGAVNLSKYDKPPSPNLPSVPDRVPGMPGAESGQPGTFISGMMPHPGKQVFNVSRNVYTYHDAAAVCAALDSELATYEQVQSAYKQGADWCNYGWVQGQMAVFPTQKDTYEKLQKGRPQYHNACGKPGVNGGYFDDPELRFGVNCFGARPSKSDMDELNTSQVALPPTTDEIEFEKQVQKFRDQLDNTTVLPFNKESWSG